MSRQAGVAGAQVNYATATARVVFDEHGADIVALRAAVEAIGYRLTPVDPQAPAVGGEEDTGLERAWLRRVVVGWPLALAVGYLAMLSGSWAARPWAQWTEFALTTVVQFYVGWPFLRGALHRARRVSADMDTLIAMGTLAAYGFSTAQLVFFGGIFTLKAPRSSSGF